MNTVLKDEPILSESTAEGYRQHHRIPEVFLIGSAKSATTSLAISLCRHPRVRLGLLKEPNFFSHQSSFAKGFGWYSSLFEHVGPDDFALDASTGYTRWPQNPGTASRIHSCAPNAKLIYLMRHPVDRAFSHFVHRWSKERYPGLPFSESFADYIKSDPMCVDSSNYQAQIQEYLEYFPENALCCLFTEDVNTDPVGALQRVARFIGVDDSALHFVQPKRDANRADEFLESRIRVQITDRIKSIPFVTSLMPVIPKPAREGLYSLLRRSQLGNRAAQEFTPPAMSDAVRSQLVERFAASNAWVAQFTGRDLSHWNQ